MDPAERKRLVTVYVRDRLNSECRGKWGKASEIAKKTGVSNAHISNVMDGLRNVGEDFAAELARVWGMEYAEMERIAVDRAASAYSRGVQPYERRDGIAPLPPVTSPEPAPEDFHPALTATLNYCRGGKVYPLSYLEEYEREARRLPRDRPREVWLADLQVKFWEWKQRGRPMAYTDDSSAEVSGVTAARVASAPDESVTVTKPHRQAGGARAETSAVRTKPGQQAPQRRAKAK